MTERILRKETTTSSLHFCRVRTIDGGEGGEEKLGSSEKSVDQEKKRVLSRRENHAISFRLERKRSHRGSR